METEDVKDSSMEIEVGEEGEESVENLVVSPPSVRKSASSGESDEEDSGEEEDSDDEQPLKKKSNLMKVQSRY